MSFQTTVLEKFSNLENALLETERNLKTILIENSEIRNYMIYMWKTDHQFREVKKKDTYSDQVKSNIVIVKPKDGNQTSSKIKEILKEEANPIENQVSGFQKAAKGAISIECTNKQQSGILLTSVAETESKSYKVELLKRRGTEEQGNKWLPN